MAYATSDKTEPPQDLKLDELPDHALRVLNGLLNLDSEERERVVKLAASLSAAHERPQDVVRDLVFNVKTGPYSDPCKCCGH